MDASTSLQSIFGGVDKKLVECWLTELEIKSLMSALAKMPDVQAMFSSVHEQGIKIIDDILGHNQMIHFGTDDISFAGLLWLFGSKKPKSLEPF